MRTPQVGEVALEERGDEIVAPCSGLGIVLSQERPRQATAHPQLVDRLLPDVHQSKSLQLDEGDSSGERLRGEAHQFGRCAPQDEEAARTVVVGGEHPQDRGP